MSATCGRSWRIRCSSGRQTVSHSPRVAYALASRAGEMLGLQERTIREVGQAGSGKRLMRVAASSLFLPVAAPGLIELFVSRAADLTSN